MYPTILLKCLASVVTCVTFIVFLTSCGKDAQPTPMYQIQSSKIQNEIKSREQKHSEEKK